MCARWLDAKGYHKAAAGMRAKYRRYNEGYDIVKKMQEEGKGLIIAPESIEGMGTLTKNRQAIKDLYVQGFRAGRKVRDFMHE
jgi:predicted patatin/cPLA2 family phospholipase